MTLQDKLLEWFAKNQRPLPWRKRYSPYEVWVSEIMLQQTQVETALPYFKRWMKTFPTIGALAKSNEKKVLKLWEGLGYYSRARNLHETAKRIVKQFKSKFPDDYETILSFKGIGPYSAGAIASIAFNQEKPIVDGNVLRVLSRLYTIDSPINDLKNKPSFWALQESLIPKGKARYFNQALMELGALVCTSLQPQCDRCPVQDFCKAFQSKTIERYPVRSQRKKIVQVEAGALILSHQNRYLIHKRPVGKIMGGLWEFPEWKLAKERRLALAEIKKQTSRLAKKEFGIDLPDLLYHRMIKRNYTYHLERLHVFKTLLNKTPADSRPGWPTAWVTKKEFSLYPFSSAHSKIAQSLF